jgi:hypothetical protein
MAHGERMTNEAFDAAEALRQREQLERFEHAPHASLLRVNLDRDHAAEALHLPGGERVSRMAYYLEEEIKSSNA